MGNVIPIIPNNAPETSNFPETPIRCFDEKGDEIAWDMSAGFLPVCHHIVIKSEPRRPSIVLVEDPAHPRRPAAVQKGWEEMSASGNCDEDIEAIHWFNANISIARFRIVYMLDRATGRPPRGRAYPMPFDGVSDYSADVVTEYERSRAKQQPRSRDLASTLLGKIAVENSRDDYVDVAYLTRPGNAQGKAVWYCPWIVFSGPSHFVSGPTGVVPLVRFANDVPTDYATKVGDVRLSSMVYHAIIAKDLVFQMGAGIMVGESRADLHFCRATFPPDVVNSMSFYAISTGCVSPKSARLMMRYLIGTADEPRPDMWAFIVVFNRLMLRDLFYLTSGVVGGQIRDTSLVAKVKGIMQMETGLNEDIEHIVDMGPVFNEASKSYLVEAADGLSTAWEAMMLTKLEHTWRYCFRLASPDIILAPVAITRRVYMGTCLFFWDYLFRVRNKYHSTREYVKTRGGDYYMLLVTDLMFRVLAVSSCFSGDAAGVTQASCLESPDEMSKLTEDDTESLTSSELLDLGSTDNMDEVFAFFDSP